MSILRFGKLKSVDPTSGGAAALTYLPSTPGSGATYAHVTGNQKLLSSYSGPTRQIEKVTGGSLIDLTPGATGVEDTSALVATLAGSAARFSILYDQTANALNDTQATATARPGLFPANGDSYGIPMSAGATATTGLGATNFMDMSASLTTASGLLGTRQSTTRIMVMTIPAAAPNSTGAWGLGTDGTAFNNLSLIYDSTGPNFSPLYPMGSAFLNTLSKSPPAGRRSIVTIIAGATATKVRIDGIETSLAASSAIDFIGGYVGRGSWASATQGPFDIDADIVIKGEITSAEAAAIEAVLQARYNVTYPTNLGIFEGDSLTAYSNPYNRSLIRILTPKLSGAWWNSDFGVAGQTAATIYGRRAVTQAAYARLNTALSPSKKFVHIWMGTNDIEAGGVGTGATVYASYIIPLVQYWKTQGFTSANIIVGTIIPRGWSAAGIGVAAKETERQSLNSLIMTDAGGEGYVKADYGAIAALTTGAANNPPDPTYYVADLVHFNTGTSLAVSGGYDLVTNVLHPLVNAL